MLPGTESIPISAEMRKTAHIKKQQVKGLVRVIKLAQFKGHPIQAGLP